MPILSAPLGPIAPIRFPSPCWFLVLLSYIFYNMALRTSLVSDCKGLELLFYCIASGPLPPFILKLMIILKRYAPTKCSPAIAQSCNSPHPSNTKQMIAKWGEF